MKLPSEDNMTSILYELTCEDITLSQGYVFPAYIYVPEKSRAVTHKVLKKDITSMKYIPITQL